MGYTSKFGPREVTIGSVATNASSQSFTALWTSFKWPHLGCLRIPEPKTWKFFDSITDQRRSYYIIKLSNCGPLYDIFKYKNMISTSYVLVRPSKHLIDSKC